jgi:hypothetical protein
LLDKSFRNCGKVLKAPSFSASLKPEGTIPGLDIKISGDLGKTEEKGIQYQLKWETLPANRDRARPEPWPEPSQLYLYKLQQ